MDNYDALEARLRSMIIGGVREKDGTHVEAADALRELRTALEAMGAELAGLKVEKEKLLGKLWAEREKATKDIDSLRSANEQLERDAGRYRWLRSAYVSKIDVPSVRLGLDDADQFDAAIDAALSAAQDKV